MTGAREPDEFTSAWWRKQFRGLTHAFNLVVANYKDLFDECVELRKSAEQQTETIDRLKEKVGELQDKQEAMAEWLRQNYTAKKQKGAKG